MSALREVIAHLRLLRVRRQKSPRATTPGARQGLVARRTAQRARFPSDRLARLRQLIGAPSDGLLPAVAVQLLASPLHLELLGDRDFPLRALGLVHVANTIDELRPLPDGLALDLEAFVEAIVTTPRGDEVTLITNARVDGELVYRAVTTALQKAERRSAREAFHGAHPAPEGEPLRRELLEVAESTGRRYARVAGDLNPIHQHAWLARPFGFRRAIVHGTWTLSRALEVARAELPRWPRTIECRFRRPVMLPSTVEVEVRQVSGETRLRVVSPLDPAFEHLSAQVRALT